MRQQDKGCKLATEYLREITGDPDAKSECLECPFYPEKCVYDVMDQNRVNSKARRNLVLVLAKAGIEMAIIAKRLHLKWSTVRKIVKYPEYSSPTYTSISNLRKAD